MRYKRKHVDYEYQALRKLAAALIASAIKDGDWRFLAWAWRNRFMHCMGITWRDVLREIRHE